MINKLIFVVSTTNVTTVKTKALDSHCKLAALSKLPMTPPMCSTAQAPSLEVGFDSFLLYIPLLLELCTLSRKYIPHSITSYPLKHHTSLKTPPFLALLDNCKAP